MSTTGQMELANQTAFVSGIGDQPGDQWWFRGKGIVAVPRVVDATRIETRHDAGSAGRADRALTIRSRERHAIGYEFVNGRRVYVFVAEGRNGVKALLVGAEPEDVGAVTRLSEGSQQTGGK